MDSIRNYLENMFLNLPSTPQVLHAKNELLQMMEDKYTELKAEGKTENEAVGTVISEFGNLEELAEELGIEQLLNEQEEEIECKKIGIDTVKEYLRDQRRFSFGIAGGTGISILAIAAVAFTDAIEASALMLAGGLTVLFVLWAVAAGICVYSGVSIRKWNYLNRERCVLDFESKAYVAERKNGYATNHAILLTIGVVLCVVSIIPAAILDELDVTAANIGFFNSVIDFSNFGGAIFLVVVAIGVFMIVFTSIMNSKFIFLLSLNGKRDAQQVIQQEQMSTQQEHPAEGGQWNNPAMEAIMSVYWPTVTSIYLIWSFLSFDWWISWIIWPIASIVHAILSKAFRNS